jgi:hypothetical protein
MNKKIWEVTVGHNWSRHVVIARNYYEAARKALKNSSAYGYHKFVKSVILLHETEN